MAFEELKERQSMVWGNGNSSRSKSESATSPTWSSRRWHRRTPLGWGRPARVEELLGDAFGLEIEERASTLPIGGGEEYWQLFVAYFGPVKTLAESLDDERREELHSAWADFFESGHDGDGPLEHTWEYLRVLGTAEVAK